MTDDYQKTPWVELGAVWRKRDTSDGRVMFTGKLGGNTELIVIGNDKKGNDKAPDLRIYVAKSQHEREKRNPRPESSRGAPQEENPGTALDYPPDGDTPF